MLEYAKPSAGDIGLEEQIAVLPARKAKTAGRDIEQQNRFLADYLVVFLELLVQGKKFVVNFFRHIRNVEDKASAQLQEIEDAEAVFCFADGCGGNRVNLGDAVIGEQLTESMQDTAELMDRSEGETLMAEDFFAKRDFLVGCLDDLAIRRRTVGHDGHTRVDRADMHDAEGRFSLHKNLHPFGYIKGVIHCLY